MLHLVVDLRNVLSRGLVEVLLRAAHLILAGSTYTGQLVSWDKYTLPLPEAMRQAFDGAPGVLFSDDGRWCSVFAPLRDSLDDIVAVLEVCAARLPSDPYV